MITGQSELDYLVKINEMHRDCQDWKSTIQFIEHSSIFIEGLLKSYIFLPNTLSLFEKSQSYRSRLNNLKTIKLQICSNIRKHEKKFRNLMEITNFTCDDHLEKNHEVLKANVVDYGMRFTELRTEIYAYALGILKEKKLKE